MTANSTHTLTHLQKVMKWIYGVTLFLLVLSGFGQMPIYKRYYIADIPGLKWTADFYNTHYLHYVAVIIFLGFIAYRVTEYLLTHRTSYMITRSGYIRGIWMAGIVFTGACLVINNFTGNWFSAGFIIFLDLAHIGFVMFLFFTSVYCMVSNKKWILERTR